MFSNVVYRRNANTAWRTIVGETIVVHLDAKEFFGLNETAADVWQALDGIVDLDDLSASFGFSPVEVAAFCAELRELGLAEVVEADDAGAGGGAAHQHQGTYGDEQTTGTAVHGISYENWRRIARHSSTLGDAMRRPAPRGWGIALDNAGSLGDTPPLNT